MRYVFAAAMIAVAVAAGSAPVSAQTGERDYTIMVPEKGAKPEKPEPWLAPKYKSPRGTVQHAVIPRLPAAPEVRTTVPPPIVVPETGRTLPNLPTISGSGPRGAETGQDRALRCAHQAGVYGPGATGDRSAYIGGCINQ